MNRRLKRKAQTQLIAALLIFSLIFPNTFLGVYAEKINTEGEENDLTAGSVSEDEIEENFWVEESESDIERTPTDPYLEQRLSEEQAQLGRTVLPDGTTEEVFSASEVYNASLLNLAPEVNAEIYQYIYSDILLRMEGAEMEASYTFTFPNQDDHFDEIWDCADLAVANARFSNPNFAWYSDLISASCRYRNNSDGTRTYFYKIGLRRDRDIENDVQAEALVNAVHEALDTALFDGMDDFEKCLALHDYLCMHNEYDYTYTRYSAYGALVEGASVCQGYYEAYELLLSYAGVPNGEAQGDNHIWNQVYINGNWYHIDCTWDSYSRPKKGQLSYSNFMKSDASIETNHTIERKSHNCTDTRYDDSKSQWYGSGSTPKAFLSATQVYYLKDIRSGSYNGTIELRCRNPLTGADRLIQTFDGTWKFTSGTGASYSYGGSHAGMRFSGDAIYFTTKNQLYKIATDGAMTCLKTLDGSRLYWGMDIENGELITYIHVSPYASTDANAEKTEVMVISTKEYQITYTPVQQFVRRMYTVALGRDAEFGGQAYWTAQLEHQKQDGAAIARGFFNSPEFIRRELNNSQYLDVLYNTFFNRSADSEGKNYWMNRLSSGTSRNEVLSGFVNSPEFASICDNYGIARGTMKPDGSSVYNPGVRSFVLRMYTKALRRNGETMGVEYWTDRIIQGSATPETVAKEFFFSPEYKAKNYDESVYLETLYETFMGRSSDAAGKKYWLDRMNYEGMSREAVLESFASSIEFKRIMAGYGL